MSGLVVTDLRVRVGGRTVLDVGHLDVAEATLVVVLGEAGSGKTVLASTLAGCTASTGSVVVDGAVVDGAPSRRLRSGIAVAVRDGERVVGCTVLEALRAAAGDRLRAGQALERFAQLATRRHVAAQHLSGGEQQLLQVACAWAAAPKVLVLDSPTVGLAPDAARSVAELVHEATTAGSAVLWLEQDPRAAPGPVGARLLNGRVISPPVPASGPPTASDPGTGVPSP